MTAEDLEAFVEYDDFRNYARERLAPAVFDHLDAGAGTNWTRDENRRAYDRFVIRKRLMVDVADTDLSVTVLGDRLELPVMLAPSAFHKFVHPDGELASGAAAKGCRHRAGALDAVLDIVGGCRGDRPPVLAPAPDP